MNEAVIAELREIVLHNGSFGPNEIERIKRRICDDHTQFTHLRNMVSELEQQEERSPASAVRLGVCYYLMGRYQAAIETLKQSDNGALAFMYQGKSCFALNQFGNAIKAYEAAALAGYSNDHCRLAIAEAKRYMGQIDEAMTILDDMFGPIEQTSEYLYQRAATVAATGRNPGEVVRLYERAVDIDPRHAGALFGLALENDRNGNDGRAIELYQRAAAVFPTNVGTLLNLGILYEDHDQYDRARRCYERILEVYPGHSRARLFLKDANASGHEFDYEEIRQKEKTAQKLKIPIAQFELSVRSRNCLSRIELITLGDLTRVTEAELLGNKNFGETSLIEIREIMSSQGLTIGMYAHEKSVAEEPMDTSHLSADEQAMLDRPVSDLNLSVRARKCMTRLGINTIGELVRKSGDDLLECKNFGVTSLVEVREKLEQIGLKLRGE